MKIRPATASDLAPIAAIHAEAFVRQERSSEWIECNYRAYPLKRIFVAEIAGQIVGYASWGEKSGFRKEAVLELEQIAVSRPHQGKGIGYMLILESLEAVKHAIGELGEQGAVVKSVLVTTGSNNEAQRLYNKAIGSQVVAKIPNLFSASADEVILVAILDA